MKFGIQALYLTLLSALICVSTPLISLAETDSLFVDTNGNVGIGTTQPQYRLQVKGSAEINSPSEAIQLGSRNNSVLNLDIYSQKRGLSIHSLDAGNPHPLIEAYTHDGENFHQKFSVSQAGDLFIPGKLGTMGLSPNSGYPAGWGGGIHTWDIYSEATIGCGTEGSLNAYFNRDGNAFFGGSVGIATTTPEYKLDVNGDLRVQGTIYGTVSSSSDARLKENVEPLDNALELVSQLRGVSYNWIDPSRGEGRQIGVIAQEVEQVLPEVVQADHQGYKSIEYGKLVAPLIEAIKALKEKNEDLEKRLKAIEARQSE